MKTDINMIAPVLYNKITTAYIIPNFYPIDLSLSRYVVPIYY